MTGTTTALEPLVARLAETAPGLRVETGPGSTGLYAYDASNYRVPPTAVVFPAAPMTWPRCRGPCREAYVPGGFEEQHYGTSMAVADLALKPRLDDMDARTPAVVVADGCS
ncbi:hypothetical protein ABZZ80_19720 [Streptomyces sp. NPDC006356]